jgi:xanthine dehydrogenase accessory factor
MTTTWKRIQQSIEQFGGAALVSIVGVVGSVPRESGARMVVLPNSTFSGTIGGGRLEYEALADAQESLAKNQTGARFRDWPLGPDLGQCCGGRVTTLTEVFDAQDLPVVAEMVAAEQAGPFITVGHVDGLRIMRRIERDQKVTLGLHRVPNPVLWERFGEDKHPLLLFGAGHVGRALVLALAPLPFAIRWIDSRENQFPRHTPRNVTLVHSEHPEAEIDSAAAASFVLVMTHSHPLDFSITAKALQRHDLAFVGLIGSETKRARFSSTVRQIKLPEADIARLVCPIGIPDIQGKEPAVIAASVAAQLILQREKYVAAGAKGPRPQDVTLPRSA